MTYDYFYGQRSELFTFYRVPKVLFTNERFWNISADAKMLYGILLDRMSLSAKNGWIDENGRVYIIFTIDEAKSALNCAEQKAIRCLIDEAANIGQIPNLEKLVATIRSREISACLVLQAQSQLKAIYKDNADTIIGNMDSRVFLGGSEPTTLKELNQALGKETIDTYNTSNTRGNSPSYGMNYQKLGKDLASVDELAVLDGGKCILLQSKRA